MCILNLLQVQHLVVCGGGVMGSKEFMHLPRFIKFNLFNVSLKEEYTSNSLIIHQCIPLIMHQYMPLIMHQYMPWTMPHCIPMTMHECMHILRSGKEMLLVNSWNRIVPKLSPETKVPFMDLRNTSILQFFFRFHR